MSFVGARTSHGSNMARRDAHADTLFHLIPLNDPAWAALRHPDNAHFASRTGLDSSKDVGLEVGFHVPSVSHGRVITRLGRRADLVLADRTVSAVHVAFEVHPETHVVLLSVRSKQLSTVKCGVVRKHDDDGRNVTEDVEGDCVIFYGQRYNVAIGPCRFDLCWRLGLSAKNLEDRTLEGYRRSVERANLLRTRDQPTEQNLSELHSWHMTRFHTANKCRVEEERQKRTLIGKGAFGTVYQTVERSTGQPIAVKEIGLTDDPDRATLLRAAIHREIKIMERLRHVRFLRASTRPSYSTLI